MNALLEKIERFLVGFEDDENQPGIKSLLAEVRSAKRPPFPVVMGQPITREEIIDGLRECHRTMVDLEREKDPTLAGYPDAEAVLNYIEQHGLPPKVGQS